MLRLVCYEVKRSDHTVITQLIKIVMGSEYIFKAIDPQLE